MGLEYSLFFDMDARLAVAGPRNCPPAAEEPSDHVFCAALEKLLRAPEFFHGDALGFGLRCVFQIENGFEHGHDLKETTRLSIQGVHHDALRFEPTIATRLERRKQGDSAVSRWEYIDGNRLVADDGVNVMKTVVRRSQDRS